MSNKQVIMYIAIGLVAAVLFWMFFGGSGESLSESAQQSAIVDDMSEDKSLSSLVFGDENKVDPEQEKLLAELKEIDESIKSSSDLAPLYYKRALLNQKLGRLRAAVSDYNKSIAANPNSSNTYYNRGLTYAKMGMPKDALEDYSKALSIKPDDYHVYNTRGLALTSQDEFQHAFTDFNRALELNKDYAPAYYNRGTLFERTDDLVKAHADYTKAIELNLADKDTKDRDLVDIRLAGSYYRRAVILYTNGDYAPALSDVNETISLMPRNVKAYQLRSSIHEKMGDMGAAATDEATAQTLSLESLLPGAQ